MGNALRIFVFCLALTAVGSTAALTQLWVHQRFQARQTSDLSANSNGHHADHQRALVVVVTVSFASLVALALVPGISSNSASQRATASRARSEINQVEHFARSATVHKEDLLHEREERLRINENLHIQQLLLNQALGEKLRLGRDLHDGVIQSLYATGLTLESARQKRPDDPAASDELFEQGIQMLNDNIREVRKHINALSQPQPALKHGFSNALNAILDTLKGDRCTEFILRIDEQAETCLDITQIPDALQIVCEAVSNALRHGDASSVTIRLHLDGEYLALLVQDNGAGFDVDAHTVDGHGLVNFRARAQSLSADFKLESKPGNGTRVVLTLPVLVSRLG
jgi:signal transduction histidine kinase